MSLSSTSTPPRHTRLGRSEALVIALSCLYVIAYLWVALNRLSTPFELEWMEGGMIAHALRLREGLPIYAPPSLDFVPFFYTPGYPATLSWLSQITGNLSFSLARGVSLMASLGVMACIYLEMMRETQQRRYALLGVGLFAALFRTCGAFYDLARPDSLMLLWLASAIIVGRRMSSYRGALLAATLMILAFFTKQTSAVFFPVILGWVLWRHARVGALFGALTLFGCWIGVLWLNAETDGSFWRYIFEGHQGHVFHWKNILLQYWRDLLFLAPLTLLLPLLWFSRFSPLRVLPLILVIHWSAAFAHRIWTLDYTPHMYYRELWYETPHLLILIPPVISVALMIWSRQWGQERSALNTSPYWLWIFIAGVGASGLNHSTQWAYSNCFMLLALSFSFSAPLMLRDLTGQGETVEPQLKTRRASITLWSLVAVQLIAWLYSPSAQVPRSSDHLAWARLTARLDSLPTPLFFPAHPTYNALDRGMRGLSSIHTHQMGVNDVQYRGGVRDLRERLGRVSRRNHRQVTSSHLGRPHWSAVITHERTRLPYLDRGYYEAERFVYLHSGSLKAKTGFLTRPASLWLPRDTRSSPRRLNGTEASANFESLESIHFTPQGRKRDRSYTFPSTELIARRVQTSKRDSITWMEAGWRVSGQAFGAGPTCYASSHQWRGEGRCGAVSDAQQRGTLTLDITLPPYAHLSLLTRATRQRSSRREGRAQRPHLELRLESIDHPRRRIRRAVSADGVWRREVLSSPLSDPSHPAHVRLSLIDNARGAGLSVDDLRVSIALDAPGPTHR